MAIGDVQNRVDLGGQFNQTGEVPNQNRQQTNPTQNQQSNPVNQTGRNADNTIQTQNIAPQQVNQPINPVQNTGGDNENIVGTGGVVPQTQNVVTQNIGQNRNAGLGVDSDERTLLEINRTETAAGAAPTVEVNTADTAVQRTEDEQIGRIVVANANEANTPPQLAPALNALSQENQLGNQIDVVV